MAKMLRRRAVSHERADEPRSTTYLRISQGLLTKPVPLGPHSVGWPAYEIEAINAALIAGKSDDEIRELVRWLEAERKNALHEFWSAPMLTKRNPALAANQQPGLKQKTQSNPTAVLAQEKHLALEISLPREIELAIKRLQDRKVEIGASLVADEALKKIERRHALSGKDRDYLHQAAHSLADDTLRQRWGI